MNNDLHVQGEPRNSSNTQPQVDRQNQEVRNLREQVHKAFMQINEVEKFRVMEAEHAAQQHEQSEKEWCRKEQQYKIRIADLQSKIKERQCFSRCRPALIDLGELDDSHFFDEIEHVNDSLRDSGIEKLQQLLTENDRSPSTELEERRKIIDQLRSSILRQIKSLSQPMNDLISLCQDMCLENCSIKEQLKNFFEANQVSTSKIQQAYSLLTRLKLNQSRNKIQINELRQQNKHLKSLYESEVDRKDRISSTLAILQEKVEKNQTENIKLHQIIKDQSIRLQCLGREHSILNENCEMSESSRTSNSSNVSNLTTLSNFLRGLPKKEQNKLQKAEQRYNCRFSCDDTTPTNMFKKKPFLMRKGEN